MKCISGILLRQKIINYLFLVILPETRCFSTLLNHFVPVARGVSAKGAGKTESNEVYDHDELRKGSREEITIRHSPKSIIIDWLTVDVILTIGLERVASPLVRICGAAKTKLQTHFEMICIFFFIFTLEW